MVPTLRCDRRGGRIGALAAAMRSGSISRRVEPGVSGATVTSVSPNQMWQVEMRTPRLTLRPISTEDVTGLANIYGEAEVSEFLTPLDLEKTERQVASFQAEWDQRGYGIFAITETASGRLIGRSGLHYWPQFDEVEVGWVLDRDAWGHGYATEAGRATLTWGFREKGLGKIIAIIATANVNSVAVASRLSMQVERTDHLFGHPVTVYSKTNDV